MIALIPARSGSERIPFKNIRELAGHPLMAYSIAAAKNTGMFHQIIVSTDDVEYGEIANHYGAYVVKRPEEFATGNSPDIEWLVYTINFLGLTDLQEFAILRPTSPFRTAETIRRCHKNWDRDKYDSVRAVEPVSQHPGKMWVVRSDTLYPLLPLQPPEQPWHSSQMKTLPGVYVQNASLEMSSVPSVKKTHTISGWRIQAFMTEGWEGFDLNTEYDWEIAERAIRDGEAKLPEVK
jgi:N-acylneuraminate cytidylyltransferase